VVKLAATCTELASNTGEGGDSSDPIFAEFKEALFLDGVLCELEVDGQGVAHVEKPYQPLVCVREGLPALESSVVGVSTDAHSDLLPVRPVFCNPDVSFIVRIAHGRECVEISSPANPFGIKPTIRKSRKLTRTPESIGPSADALTRPGGIGAAHRPARRALGLEDVSPAGVSDIAVDRGRIFRVYTGILEAESWTAAVLVAANCIDQGNC
jgi:hypothetical protein